MARRRGRSRPILIGACALVVLLIVAVIGAVFYVQSDAFKPRLIAAVREATGRELSLRGGLSIVPGLAPVIAAQDVALSNIPGGSRADMIKVQRVEAAVDLVSLLSGSIVVDRVVLVGPDILFETTADGVPNWRFSRPDREPGGSGNPAARSARSPLLVSAVHVKDGKVTYRDGRSGATTVLGIQRLSIAADQVDQPVAVAAETIVGRLPVTWDGKLGSWARLQDQAAADAPWPVQLTAQAGEAKLTIKGGVQRPLDGAGYDLQIDGAIADLASLSGATSGRLPQLRGMTVAARLADGGAGGSGLSDLAIHADLSPLNDLVPGLRLTRLDLTAGPTTDPLQLDALALLNDSAIHLTGQMGTLGGLFAGAQPIDLRIDAAGGTAKLHGTMRSPLQLAGLDGSFAVDIPNVAPLVQLLDRPMPELRDVHLSAHLTGQPDAAIAADDITAKFGLSDLAGRGVVRWDVRPSVAATLTSSRLDLNPVLVLFLPPRSVAPGAQQSALEHADALVTQSGPRRVIPDRPIPWSQLRMMDTDIAVTAAQVDAPTGTYHDVVLHTVLRDGRLSVEPFAGKTAAGAVEGSVHADATASPPTIALVVHAPGLEAFALLSALRLPPDVAGTVDLRVDLRGSGTSSRSLAGSLDGQIGVAMTDGEIDNRVLSGLASGLLRDITHVPGGYSLVTEQIGQTRVRCLASRVDLSHGVANVAALVVDTPKLLIQGAGTINLEGENLELSVRPTLRVGGPGVVVPIRIGGTLAAPKTTVDSAGTAEALAGLATRLGAAGAGGPLAALAGSALAGSSGGDPCPAALALARDETPVQPGGGAASAPAATAPSVTAPQQKPKPPKPADVLRSLLR